MMRASKTTRLLGLAVGAMALLGSATGAFAAEDRAALMKQHRGGTLKLVARSAGGTIDPQINYTVQYWTIYQTTYDGLIAFKKVAGAGAFEKVPNLAEALPPPADDGKTYVFKLRKGIKFSNGADVTVKDVLASFQRLFKVSSPTAGSFYNGIVGADKCLKEPASCTLEGGVIVDEAASTVTFHLVRPDPEFFDKLAVPHAAILPASSPASDAGTTPLPTTGPYMFASYDPNQMLKLVRNPHFKQWSEAAQPDGYVDSIEYNFGLSDEAEVTAVINGTADWLFDPPPPDRLNELGTKYAKQVHINPQTAIYYLPMNVNMAPFDNIKARQAVNFAVDRRAIVNLWGGPNTAQAACQILPPGFPGHEPYCPYTKNPGTKWSAPDLEKAKQLVEESGTKGQKVTIIVEDIANTRSVGTYLQSLFTQLGWDTSVRALSSNIQFTYIQNTNNNVQISLSSWYQDYPAASDFLNVLLGCASFTKGSDSSINIAGFCDAANDAVMQQALLTGVTDQPAADKEWAAIDRSLTDKAPFAVLFNPKRIDVVSKRLGNYMYGNQFQFLMQQAWVQ